MLCRRAAAQGAAWTPAAARRGRDTLTRSCRSSALPPGQGPAIARRVRGAAQGHPERLRREAGTSLPAAAASLGLPTASLAAACPSRRALLLCPAPLGLPGRFPAAAGLPGSVSPGSPLRLKLCKVSPATFPGRGQHGTSCSSPCSLPAPPPLSASPLGSAGPGQSRGCCPLPGGGVPRLEGLGTGSPRRAAALGLVTESGETGARGDPENWEGNSPACKGGRGST